MQMKEQVPIAEPVEFGRTKMEQNMIPPRRTVNLVHTRRKWSDWSECSANCIKTRHRLNCDDIVQDKEETQQASAAKLANNFKSPASRDLTSSLKAISTNFEGAGRQKVLKSEEKGLASANENEEDADQLSKADQAEDDDYADEGDEEDETDSCSKVDTSKTFEESACYGGLCRLASGKHEPDSPDRLHHSSARGRHQNRQNVPASGVEERRKQLPVANKPNRKVAPFASPPQAGDSYTSQLEPHNNASRPASNLHGANYRQPTLTTSPENVTRQAGETGETPFQWRCPKIGACSNPRNISSASLISPIWATIWPVQVFSDNPNLLQWIMLIGSLLTAILLIMWLIRQCFVSTFPTYKWLLAKQTAIKHKPHKGSIRGRLVQSSKECNCKHQPLHCHQALAGLSGTQLLCDEGSRIVQHHHQVGAISHQVCPSSEWPMRAGSLPETAAHMTRGYPGQQYLVSEVCGRHLLAGGAKFNTDSATPSTASHSSRASGGERANRRQHADDQVRLTSYNYDTLDSSTYCYLKTADQQTPGDKGFVLTRDFVVQSCSEQQQLLHGVGCMELPPAYQTSVTKSPGRSSRRQGAKVERLAGKRASTKQNSPKVPRKTGADKPRDSTKRSEHEQSSPSLTECDFNARSHTGSSSIASSAAEDSIASNSIQSTTAPMLSSNNGSSSFGQPAELTNDIDLAANPVALVSQPLSAGCSPANGKPRNNNSAKLIAACSQPNSPICVNQVNSNNANTRYRKAKLSARDRVRPARDIDNDESDYAQPEQNDDPSNNGHHKQLSRSRDTDERHFYEEISSQHN